MGGQQLTQALLKYPGAKWAMANWIISHFPQHHSYLEPFFGSGAVLFRKQRSNIETVNDIDDEVINLFECIREDPERIAHDIYLTPYARKTYEEAYTMPPKDKYDKARLFFVRCQMGHGFRTNGEKVGWKNDVQGRERAYAAKYWTQLPEDIIAAAERLRGVQIDNQTAHKIIQRFNDQKVLIYADPPYMLKTRHGKQYRHEMTDKEHVALLEILRAHKGPVIISGYETDTYNRTLSDWHKESATTYSQVASKKKEIIWMNFNPSHQTTLFNGMEGAI